MITDIIKVTCHLCTPLAGDAPCLDSLLEWEMSQRLGLAEKIQRHQTAPSYGAISIPMARRWIGGVLVPCCSSPILEPCSDDVERYAKRLAVEHADLLSPDRRLVVATGNNVFKSYRLPLRTRHCRRIVWFACSTRKKCLKLLKSVHSIGQKRSQGFGHVDRWEAERIGDDWSWFAPTEAGKVLMRPLPLCDELPADLIGFKQDFGACQSPYWHPDRYIERVVPV